MNPLRDGELLWVSKECLPWAIACRESFFLHKRLQSTRPHWTMYLFYATGNRPAPSYCKASQLYHICRTCLSSIGDTPHHTAFQLWHWKLSPGKLSCQQSTSCPRMSLPGCLFPCSQVCPLDCQHVAGTCVGPSGDNGGQAATWRQAHHSLQWHRVPWLIYCESVDAQRGPKCTTARCSQAKVSLLHTHFLWEVKKLNTCPPVPAWLAGI